MRTGKPYLCDSLLGLSFHDPIRESRPLRRPTASMPNLALRQCLLQVPHTLCANLGTPQV